MCAYERIQAHIRILSMDICGTKDAQNMYISCILWQEGGLYTQVVAGPPEEPGKDDVLEEYLSRL